MANIAVTYTFSNSTTADASQVNTNFTDIINGTSDGTKDLSISALTVGGTATLNGNVTLGNASSDDLTVTGSLASSIPVKTSATYNVGSSTLGLLSIYFGRNSQTVRVVPSASMAATYTLTLPVNVGSTGYPLVDSDGAGTLAFQNQFGPGSIVNASISSSVGSNALTVALKDLAGSDPSSTSPVRIGFRSATATTGTVTMRSVTSALSVVVSSGSTLGTTSAVAGYIYVYAIDNAGTVELAISSKLFQDGEVVSTTAEGGAGAADSATVMYSTTARTNVACRLIGRLNSTQTTAGTWAAAPTYTISGADGLGQAGAANHGFVKGGTLPGITSGETIGVGYVGETFDDLNTTFSTTTAANLLSRELQPGKWLVIAECHVNSGGPVPTNVVLSISTTSATHQTPYRAIEAVTSGFACLSVSRLVNITSATTYYIVGSSGTNNVSSEQYNNVKWIRIG